MESIILKWKINQGSSEPAVGSNWVIWRKGSQCERRGHEPSGSASDILSDPVCSREVFVPHWPP